MCKALRFAVRCSSAAATIPVHPSSSTSTSSRRPSNSAWPPVTFPASAALSGSAVLRPAHGPRLRSRHFSGAANYSPILVIHVVIVDLIPATFQLCLARGCLPSVSRTVRLRRRTTLRPAHGPRLRFRGFRPRIVLVDVVPATVQLGCRCGGRRRAVSAVAAVARRRDGQAAAASTRPQPPRTIRHVIPRTHWRIQGVSRVSRHPSFCLGALFEKNIF